MNPIRPTTSRSNTQAAGEMPGPHPRRSAIIRRITRSARVVLTGIGCALAIMVSCQSKLIYHGRPYPPGTARQWATETGGQTLDFHTSQGRQRAFLQGNLTCPRNLWLVCGGNATVALAWSDWLALNAPREDAWLLVDFPGYGDCEGSPNPSRIRESFAAVLPVALEQLHWPRQPDPQRLRFFGHSLGSAAVLLAASEFGIQRGVLVSPFTSTMDMTRVMTGLPLGALVWHRFDNNARLDELVARGPGKVIILHGTRDEVIPVTMARSLANQHPTAVELREIPNGKHNTIQLIGTADLAQALHKAGR